MKVKRRFPNYVVGFEETTHEFKTIDDLKEIDWIKLWLNRKDDAILAYESNTLMVVYNNDSKYGGFKKWWVIGILIDFDATQLNLKEYFTLIGDHLEGCPQKTWQHNECTCGFR